MVNIARMFVKSECLDKKAIEIVNTFSNGTKDSISTFFKNNSRLIPGKTIDKFSGNIFSSIDSDGNKHASRDELLAYLKNEFNLSEKDLNNMTVEETILKIQKALKEKKMIT